MAVHAISGLEPVKMTIYLCLRLHVADADIRSGDVIRLRARLAPPPTASYPDGFDFSRQAWFSGLGVVGFAFGPVELLEPHDEATMTCLLRQTLENWRAEIADRMTAQIKGPAGGVAAALATGLRGEIPDGVRQQMRDSGLAHLLAISGLHIGLVTAFVFALVRG